MGRQKLAIVIDNNCHDLIQLDTTAMGLFSRRNPNKLSVQLEEIWGDLRRDNGKVNIDMRIEKTMQRFRWTLGDILQEFKENKQKGLKLAKDVLTDDDTD